MNRFTTPVLIAAGFLGLFAVVGTGLVALTYDVTRERIAANERMAMLTSIQELVPSERIDNDIVTDAVSVVDRQLLGTREPVTVYRGRKQGQPVTAVLTPTAPDGYNGSIKLLVAVNADGSLAGARVLRHRETPGLGDGIEVSRSDWIRQFDGRSIGDPPLGEWAVRKDGGAFDQFTGATVTPRAVVRAIRNTLLYFRAHRRELFKPGIDGKIEEKVS